MGLLPSPAQFLLHNVKKVNKGYGKNNELIEHIKK